MDVALHRKQTVSGLKWNLLNQIISQAVVYVVSITLMRLLGPSQFGLIGMVTVFSGFLGVFRDFGLTSALIQKIDIDDLDKDTVFWVSMALGVFLSILLVVVSPLIAIFYSEPRITEIAISLSLMFLFQAFGSTHSALLRKGLHYKKLFWSSTLSVIIGGIVALIAAYHEFGVWALIIQQLTVSFITAVVVWKLSHYKPKFHFSKVRLMSHLKFGLPLLGTQSFTYWTRNADNLLIGRYLGADLLGLYSRAYSIMMLPISRISSVISSVMFPSLALIQDDKPRVKYIYLKMSRVIAMVTFPLMGILIVVAEPFVKVVLGTQWVEMIAPLQILSIIGALQSIITLNGNIFMSQGKNMLSFKITIVTGTLLVLAFFLGVQYGLNEVILIYLVFTLIAMFPTWYLMGKIIDCSIKEILENIAVQFILGSLLVLLFIFLNSFFVELSDITKLITWSICFAFLWLVGMRLFARNKFEESVELVQEFRKPKTK